MHARTGSLASPTIAQIVSLTWTFFVPGSHPRFIPISHEENHDQQIQHFTHRHPLIPVACHEEYYEFDCPMCTKPIKGSVYVCATCKYFIHKSCAKCPRHIQPPFHPPHPLTLLVVSQEHSKRFDCYACGISKAGYAFHCSECQLDLHIHCARFIPHSEDHMKTIQYFSHQHPLIPMECSKED